MLVELRERDPVGVAAVPEDKVDAVAPVGRLFDGADADDAEDVVVLAADSPRSTDSPRWILSCSRPRLTTP